MCSTLMNQIKPMSHAPDRELSLKVLLVFVVLIAEQ